METRPKLLLLDDPTRGVDVGAKFEIYELMNEWTAAGTAILLISSELPELLGMSDRIMAMHRGRVSVMLEKSEATPETVLAAAMGQQSERVQ
jgi:ribose transport system ATP-binding protein